MFYQDSQNNAIRSSLFDLQKINAGFGTRNFQSDSLKQLSQEVIEMEQIHGSAIQVITTKASDRISSVDGIITAYPNLVLTIRTADCVPLLFANPSQKLVGAVHAGWKGSMKNISAKMVENLLDQGSRRVDIIVAMGPAIGACCYKIHGDRLSQFQFTFPEWPEIIENHKSEETLNLLRLNYLQLIKAGIPSENIDWFPFCTSCDSQRFYSYNRDKSKSHMTSYIMLHE